MQVGRKHSHRFTSLSRGSTSKRGEMNQTESKYAEELEIRKQCGEIADYWFEPFSLRLSRPEKGQPSRFTPDFMVLFPDGRTILVDVKGSGIDNDAAAVRIKCAAELYPLWEFWVVKRQTKKQGGGWNERKV